MLHYLIHSYDYAPLAQRGLAAANKYAKVAPAARHAQHMPAHTYSMLGLWEQSVARTRQRGPLLWSRRRDCGRGPPIRASLMLLDFMAYAFLQMGQERGAMQMRDDS